MGKGGGCVPSKKKIPPVTETEQSPPRTTATESNDSDSIQETSLPIQPTTVNLKIFIVYYSMYGHVESLAKRIKKGVDAIEGVEGVLYRVPETLSNEVLNTMKAPVKDETIPVISPEMLTEADGILFGFPSRYGSMAAQMKAFFDSTGSLWQGQKLAGKPAGFFVSTGTQGGGQETTA